MANNNAVQVKVKQTNTSQYYDKTTIPVIFLNLNYHGMLQLGEELIRLAIEIQSNLINQVIPLQNYTFDSHDLGLHLTSESASLLIKTHPFKKITPPNQKINRIIWPKNYELNIISIISRDNILVETARSTKEDFILSLGGRIKDNVVFQYSNGGRSSAVKSWLIDCSSIQDAIEKTIQLKNENFVFYFQHPNRHGPVNQFCDWLAEGIATGRILGLKRKKTTSHDAMIVVFQTGYQSFPTGDQALLPYLYELLSTHE